MRGPSCMRAAMLDAGRASRLSAPDGLRLEEHLASCSECASDTALLRSLREVALAQDATLLSVVREQVIDRALTSVRARAPRPSGAVLGQPWLAGAGVLAAAAMVWLVLPAQEPQASTIAAVRSGELLVDGARLEVGTTLSEGAVVQAHTEARVAVAHASVTLAAGARAALRPKAHEVELQAGRLLAEVDPAPHQPFAVQTARFRVLVVGTRFEVTQSSVRVLEGRVRVVDRNGAALAELVAGERYDDEPQGQPERASAERAQEPAGGAEPGAAPLAEPEQPRRVATQAPASPTEPASQLLRQARRALAATDVAGARATVNRALAAQPSRAERAEALTLRAECALVDGQRGAAASAYLVVADRFDDLPAGENALFAAARLSAELGQRALAGSLWQRYLTRYPHGRFVSEARRRARGGPSAR